MPVKKFLNYLIEADFKNNIPTSGGAKKASAIGNNSKTIKSIDVDTVCPRKEYVEFDCKDDKEKKLFLQRLDAEKPGAAQEFLDNLEKAKKQGNWKECSYCYVKGARDKGEHFFLAKKRHEDTQYASSNILNMRQNVVDKLNAVGGIRLFSHSDYKPRKKAMIAQILNDAAKRGLDVKAITKVPQFVETFVNDQYPALKLVNVSIDTTGDGMSYEDALRLKNEHPDKVKIRAVITNLKDLLDPFMKNVDVFTFYHGSAKKLKAMGYTNFTGKDRDALGDKTFASSEKLPPQDQALAPEIDQAIDKLHLNKKTCCIGSHCSKCNLKCGGGNCGLPDITESKIVKFSDFLEFETDIESYVCETWKQQLEGEEE